MEVQEPYFLSYYIGMRYEGDIYRPPSEAESYILQATVGCSWNHCTYCDMYRAKSFRVREEQDVLEDIQAAGRAHGDLVTKVFVADGDALVMDVDWWEEILAACSATFPRLRRVSCYATAMNVNAKTAAELDRLKAAGLSLMYIGPESGDDITLKAIAKGATYQEHVDAARKLSAASIAQSVIFLLGAGGTDRSEEHAKASAKLATAMDPRFVSLLTLTVVPNTPLAKLQASGRFELPGIAELMQELRTFVDLAAPRDSIFRTNHASNYLPIGGRLPRDREAILEKIDGVMRGETALRPEWMRGL